MSIKIIGWGSPPLHLYSQKCQFSQLPSKIYHHISSCLKFFQAGKLVNKILKNLPWLYAVIKSFNVSNPIKSHSNPSPNQNTHFSLTQRSQKCCLLASSKELSKNSVQNISPSCLTSLAHVLLTLSEVMPHYGPKSLT